MEKVGFELGLLLWYVLEYTITPCQLVGTVAGEDFKYFVLISLLLFGETDVVSVVAGPRLSAGGHTSANSIYLFIYTHSSKLINPLMPVAKLAQSYENQ